LSRFAWEGTPELEQLRVLYARGDSARAIAQALGLRLNQIQNRIQAEVAAGLTRTVRVSGRQVLFNNTYVPPVKEDLPPLDEKREFTVTGGGNEATLSQTTAQPVRTLEDLIRVCEIDVLVWDIVEWKANAWEAAAKNPEGKHVARTLFQVKANLRKLAPMERPALVLSAIRDGLARAIVAAAKPRVLIRRPVQVLRQRIVSDLHIGGHAWARSTGFESWNLERARSLAFASNTYLDAHAHDDATEMGIAFLGDLGHYDTPKGNTTGGTPLDMDSRVDLMIQTVIEYVVSTIEDAAERLPVYVNLVEGNHDTMLTKAVRQAALLYFRKHKNVTIADEYTKRQYRLWMANLLGFAHGERQKKSLAEKMPVESKDWSASKYREFHTGHLHHEAAAQKLHQGASKTHDATITHGGVIVRTHLALTPTDQYHADEGWIGSQRGMSDWYYHASGGMIGTRVAIPRIVEPPQAA